MSTRRATFIDSGKKLSPPIPTFPSWPDSEPSPSLQFFLPNCCTWHLTLGRPAFSTPLSPRRQFSVPHKPQFQQHVCCLLVLNPCKRNVLNLAIIPILAIKAVFTVFAMIVYNSDLLTLLTYRPHSSRGMRTQKSSRPVSLQAGLDWSQAPRQAHLVLQAPYITWESDWFSGVSRSVLISKKTYRPLNGRAVLLSIWDSSYRLTTLILFQCGLPYAVQIWRATWHQKCQFLEEYFELNHLALYVP